MSNTYLAIAQIPVGESKTFDLHLESLQDLDLIQPIDGVAEVFVPNHTSAVVSFKVSGKVKLECDRCLSEFSYLININFRANFESNPKTEDDLPIVNNQIEVSEPIRQELIVNLPMKRICKQSCAGVSESKGD